MKRIGWLALAALASLSCHAVKFENALGASRLVQAWALGLSQRQEQLSVLRAEDSEALLKRIESGESDAAIVRWLPGRSQTLPASLHFEPVAWAAMAVYVHGSNRLTGLTRDRLREVFSGEVADWSELNGEPYELHRYGLKEGAYGMPDCRTMLVGDDPLSPVIFRVETSQEVWILVNGTPNGIGFGWFSADLPPGVEPLAVDGVKPDGATVRDGTYPWRWQIGIISRKDDALWPKEAQDFARELSRPEAVEWCNAEGWVPLQPVETPAEPAEATSPAPEENKK